MQLTPDDFARLEEMDREANARLSERDFVGRLLPHLIPNEDGSVSNRRVDIYVEAAGHAQRMIDVYADNDPTKILYTVPPLISPTPMVIRSVQANPETDIGELSATFEAQITTAHPGAVIEAFVHRLMALNYSPADAISTVYSMMWAKIYRRYNIPLERLFGENAAAVEKQLGLAPQEEDAQASKRTVLNEIADDDIEPL
ncbi:hypothetical protein PA10_00152 [Pseudomonas phage pPa_SNUABM_DT01]|nr:hypothetical protein PA10_00152 [Pseudomonas phage pPa_SNUABM_DT01]